MVGGEGNDLLLGGKGGDKIDAGPGNDVLAGGSGADILRGGPGDDLVWATDFERNSTDVIDPSFIAAPGDNEIDCGDGNDMVVIDLADDRGLVTNCEYRIVLRSTRSNCSPVSRWLHGGRVKPGALLDLSTYPANPNRVLDTPSPFGEKPAWPTDEGALLSCSDFAARYLTDPTDDLRPNVRGTIGDDVLLAVPANQIADARTATLGGSPDGASVFNAGEGSDTVTGSAGADTVLGGDGEDRLSGLGGDDSLEGEGGDDLLWGGVGADVLFGRTGDDALWGEDGSDYLEGGRGADRLSGGAGDDRLFGGRDADRLKGGAGDDELVAFDGSADLVDCGPGDDVAQVDRRDRVIGCEHVSAPRSRRR
jgi:Ca2+-binding RTX toxin-like protein